MVDQITISAFLENDEAFAKSAVEGIGCLDNGAFTAANRFVSILEEFTRAFGAGSQYVENVADIEKWSRERGLDARKGRDLLKKATLIGDAEQSDTTTEAKRSQEGIDSFFARAYVLLRLRIDLGCWEVQKRRVWVRGLRSLYEHTIFGRARGAY